MKSFPPFIIFAIILGGDGVSQSIAAQATVSQNTTVEERLETLDRKQRALGKKWASERERAETNAAASLSFGDDGFVLRSADGNSKIRIGGYIQSDGRFYLDDNTLPATDSFLLRRARPILEGVLFKYFDFKLMPDFGDGKASIIDAYTDVSFLPELKLQIGKFKTPFGLEYLQSARTLEFVERALPSDLVPNRDTGVLLHGDISGGVFGYAVGVFNGAVDGTSGDSDVNASKDFAGRIFAHPFKQSGIAPLKGLGIGFAGTYGKQQGSVSSPILPAFRTSSQRTFFNYRSDGTASGTVIAQGDRFRISPQASYYWGPLGILGEYIVSSQEVVRNGMSAKLENKAWQGAVFYVLTGEFASYTGVNPKRPFDPHDGNWGAFELVGRYHGLDVDNKAFPIFADETTSARKARTRTLGINWYLNNHVKFNLDYENTKFTRGADTGDREDDHAVMSRFQIVF